MNNRKVKIMMAMVPDPCVLLSTTEVRISNKKVAVIVQRTDGKCHMTQAWNVKGVAVKGNAGEGSNE
ncbi:TPA: hypothetical protein ACNTUM_000677 [Escherichia coli]|nr:hypothetical protein [Escherichia coli]HCO3884115.1 hypothetical protein [Escherichia coli]